jgi:hypothetical protein
MIRGECPNSSHENDGLMSKEDKKKVSNIPSITLVGTVTGDNTPTVVGTLMLDLGIHMIKVQAVWSGLQAQQGAAAASIVQYVSWIQGLPGQGGFGSSSPSKGAETFVVNQVLVPGATISTAATAGGLAGVDIVVTGTGSGGGGGGPQGSNLGTSYAQLAALPGLINDVNTLLWVITFEIVI